MASMDPRGGALAALSCGLSGERLAESFLERHVAALLDQCVDFISSQPSVQRIEDSFLAQQVGSVPGEAGGLEECRCGSDESSGALSSPNSARAQAI